MYILANLAAAVFAGSVGVAPGMFPTSDVGESPAASNWDKPLNEWMPYGLQLKPFFGYGTALVVPLLS